MSLRYTMASTKPLIIVILLAIYILNIRCEDVSSEIKPANDLLNKPYPLATSDRELRGILDHIKNIANQIKNRAIASWNYLKRVAEGTRNDILKWANSAKQYAIKLEKSIQDQLQALRYRLNEIISDVLGTGKFVQQCLKDEGENIKHTLKDISYNMANCVSNQISKLTQINGKHQNIGVNDTLFIADLDRKIDACEADKANYEDCLNTVRDLVYDDIEEKHNEIQQTGIESRSLTDNIRETLVNCALQNIGEATSFLSSEVMEIVRCALKKRGINESILE